MSKYIKSSLGNKIAYQQTPGNSPGVIFLGGFMSDMAGTKAMFLESLCQRLGCSFVRFDYFGHGVSEGTLEKGTIGQWLNDMLAVFDQLTEGPQVVVGSSMGGWLMLLLALQRAVRIKALVGIAAAPDFLEDFSHLSFEQHQTLMDEGICYIPSQYGDRPYTITKKMIIDAEQHYVLKGPIAIQCPVHLLHGLNDPVVSWDKSMQLVDKLESKEVKLTLIKNGDHRLTEHEHLAMLANIVKNYILVK